MRSIREPAWAKINLTLDVLSKRPDGYHDLESIMQAVSLKDDITIIPGTKEPWSIQCDRGDIPCDRRNLAWKAAKLFCESTGWDPDGLQILISKQIPSEAGLGGGSADAAAVLRALNRCVPQPLSIMELAQLGSMVGSDVPFCVICGTAFCEGRGEILKPFSKSSVFHYVLCKPALSFSTPKLFAKLDEVNIIHRPNHGAMLQALESDDPETVGEQLCNVFEAAVQDEFPEIAHIKNCLLRYGACGAQMTGSGSVVYGIFPSQTQARRAWEQLRAEYPNSYLCQSV